ncbi:hypothetical protein TRIUR3_17651 [Triticum urartu]|uniref:Uncharacterized protein n=2 Tax=Triticum TaxID=4564 RepID=A0A9R0Q9I2_TRITD|nr:hypothetical protein TRIUR3_17651 [Triticum urartu]VAH05986.1 unnamed protein product [Triticum turgidum subsp. durum]
MARSVSYVSAAKLVSMARGNRVAVIDVSFAARLPELVQATSGKDTLVFHCALSQVKIPASSRL